MAKKTTKTTKTTARKAPAARTAKVGNTTIKGLTDADMKQVEAGKASADDAKANTRTGAATPEAQNTAREKTLAANRMFEKADEDGKAQILAETRASLAALGR